jgi:putative membrane protein
VKLGRSHVAAAFLGSLGGIIVGVLPGMSPSQVGILLWEFLGANLESFLVSVSAINTSDAIHSLVTLYTLGNARSGVATMIGEVTTIGLKELLLLAGAMGVSGLIALLLYFYFGKLANRIFGKLDYYNMNLLVLALMVALVYYFTGAFGLLVAAVATCIGVIPILSGVSRTHLMGVLIVPTMLFYFGIS